MELDIKDGEELIASSEDQYIELYPDHKIKEGSKEALIIGDILSMDLAIFLLRRTTGGHGLSIESLRKTRRSLITAYEKKYRKFEYPNDDIL